jgi:5-formyltetrahydrofolate cyclo-ligase
LPLQRNRDNVIPKEPLNKAAPVPQNALQSLMPGSRESKRFFFRASLKRDGENVICPSLRAMRSDVFLRMEEGRKQTKRRFWTGLRKRRKQRRKDS